MSLVRRAVYFGKQRNIPESHIVVNGRTFERCVQLFAQANNVTSVNDVICVRDLDDKDAPEYKFFPHLVKKYEVTNLRGGE
jgi:hypothetical protein